VKLVSNVVETLTHNGRTIEICHDSDAESPREWDNVGTMVCFHKRYNLGDKTELRSSQFESFEQLRHHLVTAEGAAVVLPLYLFDHSGLSMSTDDSLFRACDSQRWDWGQVGYIYVTRKKIMEEWGGGGKYFTKAIREKAEQYLRGEVETYHQYLAGEVYGYVVKGDDDEHEDSCWGFFGLKYCIEQAKEAADAASRNAANQAECAHA
jgi:hypothetical protein